MSEWEDIRRQARAVIGEEEPLRLDLPERDGAPIGRLFVDHAAPALAVHRCPPASPEHPARCSEAHRLVTSQPAYLLASAAEPDQAEIRTLATATAESLADRTGAALLIEVWTPFEHDDEDVDPFGRRPGFTLYVPDAPAVQAAGAALADALSGIEIAEQGADVTCITTDAIAPPGLAPLVDGTDGRIALLGLAVDAVFLNPREGEFYPRVLDALRSALAPALATATQTFAREAGTPAAPAGRRHLEPVAEVVDRGLSELSREYGFLLQVTPVNAAEAWDAFQTGGFETAPELLYRPLTFDPDALRRQLFALPVERVEDPDVAALLREKRDEIGAEVQMILDRETPGFLAGSLKVYGAPDDRLVALAHGVLDALRRDRRRDGVRLPGPRRAGPLPRAIRGLHLLRGDPRRHPRQPDGVQGAPARGRRGGCARASRPRPAGARSRHARADVLQRVRAAAPGAPPRAGGLRGPAGGAGGAGGVARGRSDRLAAGAWWRAPPSWRGSANCARRPT